MTIEVSEIYELLEKRFGLERENLQVATKRIDVPSNKGNNGIFLHNIEYGNNKKIQILEKFATSKREWLFFENKYDYIWEYNRRLVPEFYAYQKTNPGGASLFMEYSERAVPDYSKKTAEQISLLIDAVSRLPRKGLESHPSRLVKLEKIGDL